MRKYFYYLLACTQVPLFLFGQGNVGIGGNATRARIEVFGVAGAGNTAAVFGSDGAGISFQQNWPTVGFNQYRNGPGGYGIFMHEGFAAVQYMDPASGAMALDIRSVAGTKDAAIPAELHRSFTLYPNGTVGFGKGSVNANLTIDYLNINNVNTANGSIYFYGTQYPSFINASQPVGMGTQLGPGKDNGILYINDLPGNNVVIGGNGTKVGINTSPFYITTLSIRHALAGGGLLLIDQNSSNNWEWYVSNDNPVWIGQKYNGNLIGDYNPATGVHGYVSDRRLKTAIQPMRPLLDKVMQLRPVQYRMKNADPALPVTQGFLAQEVQQLFPEMVSIVSEHAPANKGLPDLQMLNYSQFFVVVIKAMQEQQAEIAALNKELSKLEQLKN